MSLPILSLKQNSPEWQKMRERALNDLFFMASAILGYTNLFPLDPETHLLFCKFIERKTGIVDIDTAPVQKCETPRGTGKTSIGTIAHAIQLACRDPNISIMIANEKAETADSFLSVIKTQFETNDLLRLLFPEVLFADFKETTWKTDAATLKRERARPEPTFFTTGVGGTRTGMHPDCIIVDDPISKEAMENARVGAWQIMERVNRWCNELKLLLNTQAAPFPWIRFNGTRWWQGDTYEFIEKTYGYGEEPRRYRLKAKLPDGRIVSREVYRVGQMSVFRAAAIEDGLATYPKIYSLEKLAELRSDDPELWSCNLMNAPSDAAVRTFQNPWLRYYDVLDEKKQLFAYRRDDGVMRYVKNDELRKILIVDPAFTAGGQGARSAIIVTGTDVELNKHLVLEAEAARKEPRDLVIDILNIAKLHRLSTVYIELVAQQAGFLQFVQNEARARNQALAVEAVKPGGRNKALRIESLSAFFKAGQILVHRSQLDLLNEYGTFRPGARYVDLLDALAYAGEKWPLAGPGGAGSASRRAKEQLDGYYAKRGLTPV